MAIDPVALLAAHPWRRVTCTTYALSLSFFEAVILDGLVRGASAEPMILSDVHGVRESLSEGGAQRIGKDYQLEPVAVPNGVFHPKVTVLTSESECHVLVGSGNLTFGGWGGNCELVEHLHPSFAAGAIADVAAFFEELGDSQRVRHEAGEHCGSVASDLRQAVRGQTPNPDIRFIHNLRDGLGGQLAEFAGALGGARQLVVAAPYWDDGAAIDRLCGKLALPQVLVHAHQHGVVGGHGANQWPRRPATRVTPVRLDILTENGTRRLHAKAFEILCARGRIIVSGSANATAAALEGGRNIEACVVRVQRERTAQWGYSTATALPAIVEEEQAAGDPEDTGIGVVRAVLDGNSLAGRVFTPRLDGPAVVSCITSEGTISVGEVTLDPAGRFEMLASNLETASWQRGRMLLRIEGADGRRAEGFVFVVSYFAVVRRVGPIARRLIALVAGHETPEDVGAILDWLREDPRRLSRGQMSFGGSRAAVPTDSDVFVKVGTLSDTGAADDSNKRSVATEHSWERLTEMVLAVFRKRRRPGAGLHEERAGDEGEDDSSDEPGQARGDANILDTRDTEASNARFRVFEAILGQRIDRDAEAADVLEMMDLGGFICDRLGPEAAMARRWLARLVNALCEVVVPAERRSDVTANALALLGTTATEDAYRATRSLLIRLKVDLDGEVVDPDGASGFLAVLPQKESFREMWIKLRRTRSYEEQRRALLDAIELGRPSQEYPDLRRAAAEDEWNVIERAIESEQHRHRVATSIVGRTACPACDIQLPQIEVVKLKTVGIATAVNCCQRVIVWEGV